jgi:hypothetical protein
VKKKTRIGSLQIIQPIPKIKRARIKVETAPLVESNFKRYDNNETVKAKRIVKIVLITVKVA